jgi:hypothetical protein
MSSINKEATGIRVAYRPSRRRLNWVFATVLLMATAWGGSSFAQGLADGGISKGQEAALADGHVTYDEYKAAFGRYVNCVQHGGYSLAGVTEEYRVIQYSIPAEAVNDGTEPACYSREFDKIDETWQVANEDDSREAAIIRACLNRHGIQPRSTYVLMFDQLRENGIPIQSCPTSLTG